MKVRAEAIAERLGVDADRKAQPTAADHIADTEQFVATKTWTMSEVLEYHGFESCF